MRLFSKIILISFCLIFAVGIASADTTDVNLPTGEIESESPGELVKNFYTFSLMISGILAFGVVVYGGITYTLAAGNPSGQSEGKEWIKGALLGILLLASALLILNTINPDITSLSIPGFEKIENSTPNGGGITGQANEEVVLCGGTTSGQCAIEGQTCVNKGSFGNSEYVCVSEESFDCGGKQFGDCPPRQSCVNTGGDTLETVRYECKT